MKEARPYSEAIKMVVEAWMKETFGDKYEHNLPDEGLQQTQWFLDSSLEKRMAAVRVNKYTTTAQMNEFKKWLTIFHEMFKNRSKREDLLTLYCDYQPNESLRIIVEKSGFNIVLLPQKMHTTINANNQVWIRVGHYVGTTAFQ